MVGISPRRPDFCARSNKASSIPPTNQKTEGTCQAVPKHPKSSLALVGSVSRTRPGKCLVNAETTRCSALESFLTAAPDPGRRDDVPFEAIVIYPQRSQARLLPQQSVKRDLPKGTGASLRTLWSAVDLDGDGAADVEIFRFCCDRPSRASRSSGPSPCESDCENTYFRSKGRPWSLVNEAGEF